MMEKEERSSVMFTTPARQQTRSGTVQLLSDNLFLYSSTCNVYILRSQNSAVLVDFGDGSVLDALPLLGIETVTDVLMTHHHRDQAQGLARAEASGIRIWVPSVERELFGDVDAHWQGRSIMNNYNTRQDRFSLLEPVTVSGTLEDYARYFLGGYSFEVLPTPGHTTGSLTLLCEVDGRRAAFTGDLIAAPGKVWSMAATQWTYNGQEGAALTLLSLAKLKDRQPEVLLPSHGHVITDPDAAIDLLFQRLRALLDARGENPRMLRLLEEPYRRVSPHLLINQTSMANSYVLLSQNGKALLIDFGYDFIGGVADGQDRASRRPWLYTLPVLKRDFGVSQVDVAIPTHYHDDHVAGLNLLQRVEGAQLWIPDNFASILCQPSAYDLPCLWYDPILADRMLPLDQPVSWEEYQLTLHPLPGHTRYAVAISVEVDGQRMLFTGDQYQGENGLNWNYVYQNHFRLSDYRETAELYARLQPDVILSGHWSPLYPDATYFSQLRERAEMLERMHRDLLPLEEVDLDADGTACRIFPYLSGAAPGEALAYTVTVVNPLPESAEVCIEWVLPEGWQCVPPEYAHRLSPGEEAEFYFEIRLPEGLPPQRRARLAVDMTAGGVRFGQQAECLVNVLARQSESAGSG